MRYISLIFVLILDLFIALATRHLLDFFNDNFHIKHKFDHETL